MKKFFILNLLILILIMGCSTGPYGQRSATLDSNDDGVEYRDKYVGFFMPTVGPEELANAELTRAMAERIRRGDVGQVAGKFVGVVINQDDRRNLRIYHPSLNQQVVVKPGGHTFLYTTDIPDHLNIRWSGRDRLETIRTYEKSKVYHGVDIDYGVRTWAR